MRGMRNGLPNGLIFIGAASDWSKEISSQTPSFLGNPLGMYKQAMEEIRVYIATVSPTVYTFRSRLWGIRMAGLDFRMDDARMTRSGRRLLVWDGMDSGA